MNKALTPFDAPFLDVTLTQLEGCYRELRLNFTVAVERSIDGWKFVTRWAGGDRGGVQCKDWMHYSSSDSLSTPSAVHLAMVFARRETAFNRRAREPVLPCARGLSFEQRHDPLERG